MRYLDRKDYNKDKKRYLFDFRDLELLYQRLTIELIKESNLQLVPIDNLELTEYFPQKFEEVKTFSTNQDILDSLISAYNYQKVFNLMKEEGGKSDAFIFATHDQRFIIKTIPASDKNQFLYKMLPKYLERIKNDPESRLVRILGVFKILPMKQYFMIMENLLPDKEKCVIFDLKGSKVARLVHGIDNPQHPPLGSILKDINFMLYRMKLTLSPELKLSLITTLRNDFDMLRECGVIDYSMLLGIYVRNINSQITARSLLETEDGIQFTLGVIDIFQRYNFQKASEKTLKSLFNKKNEISSAAPTDYFNRICEFSYTLFE